MRPSTVQVNKRMDELRIRCVYLAIYRPRTMQGSAPMGKEALDVRLGFGVPVELSALSTWRRRLDCP